MSWIVVFLNTEVKTEFLALPADIRADLARIFTLIEKIGLTAVGMPYVRHIQDKIWEMRGRGKSGTGRSLYVAHVKQRVVILKQESRRLMMERALDYLPEMKEPEFKHTWDALENEYRIAATLIEARRKAGMTQAEAAKRMGVSQPAIARIESGRNISIKSLKRYASAIGQQIPLVIHPG